MPDDHTLAPQPSPIVGQDSLSTSLSSQWEAWRDARKPQEEKLLDAYNDAMRIPRDDDTKDSGIAKAKKAKLFVGSTRGKIRSARAKIKDSLFGSGKMPFDTTPSKEEAKEFADTMEDILTWQLKDMSFKAMLGGAINSLCTYGTSVVCGPFEREKSYITTEVTDDPMTGFPRLGENEFKYRCPYFEQAPTMDFYPDPTAADEQVGRGNYWSSWHAPHELEGWADLDGYSVDALAYASTQLQISTASEGSDRAKDSRANINHYSKDGRIRVLRYFGRVDADALAAWEAMQADPMAPDGGTMAQPEYATARLDEERTVEAIVIMAGGVVVKADRTPYKPGKRPVYRAVYEQSEHEFWGVGIAENNEPHQKVVNAAFRMYLEGKAMALLKTCSIDRSKFTAGEDFKLFPGKRYEMRGGLTPDERKTAIIWHDVQDVTAGWENVIGISERFSDDDTGITKYSQGTDSQHLNNTASGISMIMNASSLPMKEVIQNIDDMWIEKMLEALVDWNMANLEPEVVRVILGERPAAIWTEIQKFGKTSFMKWVATGSSTFMVKEILMNKLQGFMQLVMSSPVTAEMVDVRELLDQIWQSGEIGKETPVLSDEELQKKKAPPGLPPEIEDALGKQDELITNLEAAAKTREGEQAVRMAEIESRERIAMADLEVRRLEAAAKIEKTLTEVDKLEAETVNINAQTGLALTEAEVIAATEIGEQDGQ